MPRSGSVAASSIPKDKGYAKFLVTLGYDRNWAGMLAAMIVEEGRVRAATSKKSTEFARALRRLANPRLGTEAFLANVQVVLEAMSGTTLRIELSDERRPFDGLAFIFQLRFCLAGDLSGRAEVVENREDHVPPCRRLPWTQADPCLRCARIFSRVAINLWPRRFHLVSRRRRLHRPLDSGDARGIRRSGLQSCAGAGVASKRSRDKPADVGGLGPTEGRLGSRSHPAELVS